MGVLLTNTQAEITRAWQPALMEEKGITFLILTSPRLIFNFPNCKQMPCCLSGFFPPV